METVKNVYLDNLTEVAYEPDSPCALPGALTIRFDSRVYRLTEGELLVTTRLNGVIKQYRTDDCTVTLDGLCAGILDVEIRLIALGEVAKIWHARPLLIREIEGNLTSFDAVTDTHNRLLSLVPTVETMLATLKTHENRLNGTAMYDFNDETEE